MILYCFQSRTFIVNKATHDVVHLGLAVWQYQYLYREEVVILLFSDIETGAYINL